MTSELYNRALDLLQDLMGVWRPDPEFTVTVDLPDNVRDLLLEGALLKATMSAAPTEMKDKLREIFKDERAKAMLAPPDLPDSMDVNLPGPPDDLEEAYETLIQDAERERIISSRWDW